MPFLPAEFLCGISNTLIAEERSYDIQTIIAEHQQLHSTLNRDQTGVYNSIIEYVHNKSGKFFFCTWERWMWKDLTMANNNFKIEI